MSLTQNEATRFINVIDERIKKLLGRGTVLEITYGEVDSISGRKCAVLIGGDTNPSGGFRIPAGLRVQVGDRVRVVIDPRGDRWVAEVFQTTTYPKMLWDSIRGTVYSGDGTSDPTVMLYQDGFYKVNTDGGYYAGNDSLFDASVDVSGNLTVGGDITTGTGVTAVTLHSTSGLTVDGHISLGNSSVIQYSDTILYRESSFTMATDGHFVVDNNLYLGLAKDTYLYRSAADKLATPDQFSVGTPETAGGSGAFIRPTGSIEIVANGGTAYLDLKTDATTDYAVRISYDGTNGATWSGSSLNIGSGLVLKVNGTQVVTSRRTGWGAPTGTATRSAFATSTVTTAQLAERVKALIDDLTTHGLIGS